MEHLARTTSTTPALGEALDVYFARLNSVACVTIVDELMRALGAFYDAAAASDGLTEFRACCQNHPLHGLLLEDPFTAQIFSTPHGQPANAALFDFIYRPRYLKLSEVGEAVHFVTSSLGAARSIALRRDRFAKVIAQTVRGARKARILSVGNGHLRELDTARGLLDRRDFQLFALDPDSASLREAVNANPDFNIVPLQQPVWHFVRQDSDAGFDLIYAGALFDHANDHEASDLLDGLAQRLGPGGRLIIGNWTPENHGRGYMEGMMGWGVHHRREMDLERLSNSSKLSRFRTYRDAPGNIVYLEVAAKAQ